MNFKKGFNSHEHYLCVNMQFKKKKQLTGKSTPLC